MNKLIGILLRLTASVIYLLARSTVFALAIHPGMADGLVENMTLLIVEITHTVLTVGTLAAIERASAQQRGEFCQSNAIDLMVHDMVDTLLTIGNRLCQTTVEPLDYLPQEDTRLAEGVEER